MFLYLMRHGETSWNKQGLIQGSADIPLNEYGVQLAKKTRDGLKREGIHFDRAFTSPYIRAKKTAEILLEGRNVPLTVEPKIREMCFGRYEGIRIAELRTNPDYIEINKCFDDPLHYTPEKDSESYAEVFTRIRAFLTETILPLENSCQSVLAVCHGAVLRAFLCILKDLSLEEYWSIHQPNCSVNVVRVQNGRFTVERENWLFYEEDDVIHGERRFV